MEIGYSMDCLSEVSSMLLRKVMYSFGLVRLTTYM